MYDLNFRKAVVTPAYEDDQRPHQLPIRKKALPTASLQFMKYNERFQFTNLIFLKCMIFETQRTNTTKYNNK